MNHKRIEIFRDFTQNLATLSKCTDKQVACIITNKEGTQVYSIGVNGGPKGGRDCLCTLGGRYTCIHAEANAIAKCTVADPDKVVFCTFSPCVTCAALLLNAGLSELYYVDSYKDDTGLQMLRDAGVLVRCITDAAMFKSEVLDYASRLDQGETVIMPRNEHSEKLLTALNELKERHTQVAYLADLGDPTDSMMVRWE